MAVGIVRDDLNAAGFRSAAAASRDGAAARRMLALALVVEGVDRTTAARTCGMDRQTLRDWVHRYNEAGLGGLSARPHGGGPRRLLSAEQEEAVAALVRSGPDPAEHAVVRWRRVDLAAVIDARFGGRLAERTVGALYPLYREPSGHAAQLQLQFRSQMQPHLSPQNPER